jgi:hypothetical protein
MRARVGLVFALVVLVLTGCAKNAPADEPGQNPPSPSVSEVTSTLLEYGRQGGLKGADDHLVVKRDGSYTLTRRNQQDVSGTLTQEQLAGLQQALAASNFKSIPHVNKGGTIADGYTYRVVYDGYEVLAEDGAIPPALKNVITTLNAVLSS